MSQTIYNKENVFAKIIEGKIPSQKIYEDDKILAFKDANPAAPTHVLVIPKGEYINFADFSTKATSEEVSYFFKKTSEIAKEILGLSDFRIISNNGANCGQSVFHFHIHILGGKQLSQLL